jgi:cell wall-associated NlpC family hydrolase
LKNVKIPALLPVILLPLLVIGCASTAPLPPPVQTSVTNPEILNRLYDQYNDWRGVRFQEGGLSKGGIDCSGYVYLTYREKFHRNIPRSTELLAHAGVEVNPRQIRPGDLVFFRTGRKKRHVGIYLQNGSFMHASSSRGVMISKLRNPYWSDAFWMARRMN